MIVAIPAAAAARTPLWESSSAKQFDGSTLRSSAALRKVSGCGLLILTSLRVTSTSKLWKIPAFFSWA